HSIAGIPLYNFDVEQDSGIPQPVAELKEAIAAADGLVIASPEYNNSIPGVLKNTIDWLSRPPEDIPRVFGQLPVAIMGATPGIFGTTLAQTAWLPVMRTLGTQVWTGGRLLLPRAGQALGEPGQDIDEALQERLQKFMSGFVAFVRACKAQQSQ
ncbi:MAG TPA: NADPH-dependent FMN reductase, partial [Xanthomonadales bacterium]|nr:NADPH-dependent FMN reductase [Xanthomonadales bacterium]